GHTALAGGKAVMGPANLIITPPMRGHGHGREDREPVIWLDALDIPLVRHFDAAWASKMRPAQPPATPSDPSQDELTASGLVPRHSRYPQTGFPQVRWPWITVRAALERLAATTPRGQAVSLRYV